MYPISWDLGWADCIEPFNTGHFNLLLKCALVGELFRTLRSPVFFEGSKKESDLQEYSSHLSIQKSEFDVVFVK